jgi:excinuclease ABC subunit C
MVSRIRQVEAVVCDSVHEAAWLERNLLEHDQPRWNQTPGGQEVPAYICLQPSASGPRLAVVHRPPTSERAQCFGPYLGGTRVRVAVAGLRRAFPLACGEQRHPGSARALAHARASRLVQPSDPAALITALLLRDQSAAESLYSRLRLLRDDAAAELAFEVAARVQAETEALRWVLAEQKVTVQEQFDLDVHGWAHGALVRFEIRGGRLCSWTVQEQPRNNALLAATPGQWRPFTQRNAELAARLREATGPSAELG